MPTYKPNWMPKPRAIADCPPGLEYLAKLDQILIQQQIERLEVWTGYETENKYWVKNNLGQDIYYAAEKSEWGNRMCCGANRAFHIEITDCNGSEVIHIFRPLRWGCPFDYQFMEVYAPVDVAVGYVVGEWMCCIPEYIVQNANKEAIFRINGPCCGGMECGSDVDFQVLNLNNQTVGEIKKKWGGWLKETFTDADTFGITFPKDIDVRTKALMLGACFLVDFDYYENR